MPFFPLGGSRMSAENMIFMSRNKNRLAESGRRISADWMWKLVKTIFSRAVGREKQPWNGFFISIWAFRMYKYGVSKCRTECFMAYSPTVFWPEEEGTRLSFCRFSCKKLSFGLWHEARDSRVCARCAVDAGIWKPRVVAVDKMTKSKFPVFLFGGLQKKSRFFFCGVQINFISLSSRR